MAAASYIPSQVIDAHVHFISLENNISYTWAAPPTPPLACPCVFATGPDFLPCACEWSLASYAAASANRSASRVVFVEVAADPADWLKEAQWVQSLADGGASMIGGIVAHFPPGFGVPGADLHVLGAALDALAALPLARGIRAAALNFSDTAAFGTLISHAALLAARGLSLDIITAVGAPGVGAAVAALAAALPVLTIVLDHVGSPDVTSPAAFQPWADAMALIGRQGNVFVKTGGLLQYYKAAAGPLPSAAQTTPYIVTALKAFGWEKALWEQNYFFDLWPKNLEVTGAWLPLLDAALATLSPTDAQLDALYAGNAVRAYRVQL